MSIADKITRLTGARDDIVDSLAAKGVPATGHGFEDFASDIDSISTGIDVSDTTATAAGVRTGLYFYTSGGVKTEGTMPDASAGTSNSGTNVATITPGASAKYANTTAGYTPARKWTVSAVSNLSASNIVNGKTVGGVTGTGTYYDYYRSVVTSGSSTRTMKTAWNGSGGAVYYATYTIPTGFRCVSLYFIGQSGERSNGVVNFDGSLNGGTRCVVHDVDDTHAIFADSTTYTQYCSNWSSSGYARPDATVYIPAGGANKNLTIVAVGYNV